jgi:hypothetical protein
MRVLDAGHFYQLAELDYNGRPESFITLQFVKREGPKYPGNKGHHSGTTTQEVLRACCNRLRYVNNQMPRLDTQAALSCLQEAIRHLEVIAARIHGRPIAMTLGEAEFGPCCPKCGHVGCQGGCH